MVRVDKDGQQQFFSPASGSSRATVEPKIQKNGFLHLSNTHDVSLVDQHIPDAETFASDLQDAVNALWPTRHQNRYTQVTALLVSWQDDNLGVEKEIQGLRRVFEDFYHFDVEEYHIPSDKPGSKTQARIMELLAHDSFDSLFIIYYAGHASPGRQGSEAPIWAATDRGGTPTLPTGGLQLLFEEASADVLLLNDCCHSAHASITLKGHGVTEVIAACGFEAEAPAVGPHSFTTALIDELAKASSGPPFPIGWLHSRIVDSLKNWKRALLKDEQGHIWRDINGKVQEECHKRRTPIHLFLTNETTYRSIFLAPLAPKSTANLDSGAQSSSASSNSVLLAIRISEDYLATDSREHKIYEWREWIRNIPLAARDIKIQGVYESFSTLVLLSVPTAVWTLLPENPAYSFIGFITSDNILSSLDSPQPHQSLTIPEFSQVVETPTQIGYHNVPYSMPITVDQQRAVVWLMQQIERLEVKNLRPEGDRDDISQASTLLEPSKYKDRIWAHSVEMWSEQSRNCKQVLGLKDVKSVARCPDASYLRAGVDTLIESSRSLPAAKELLSLTEALDQFEDLNDKIGAEIKSQVDLSSFWGAILLLITLSTKMPRSLYFISKMIKGLAREVIDLSNGTPNGQNPLNLMTELSAFFVEAIVFLRREKFDDADEAQWATLDKRYQMKLLRVKERPERANNSQGIPGNYSKEISCLQQLVQMPPATQETRLLLLPRSRNTRFFARTEVLHLITGHFKPDRSSSVKPMSMALYGLGGVGKSAIALEYAYRRLEDYDAIFWVSSETQISMARSFSDIAIKLRLGEAHENPQDHAANRYLVQKWLQRTSLRWLMIFDNVESPDLLRGYWPLGQGHSLVTTRNHTLAFHPADWGLEVHTFPNQEGAEFLIHLLSRDVNGSTYNDDLTSATQLSTMLGGHALAISHIARLIHQRSSSISEFLKVYEKQPSRFQRLGNFASLWSQSFESLISPASNLLALLCLLDPDIIPKELFEFDESIHVPDSLWFAQDEHEFSEALENLLSLALIRRNIGTRSISIHRLVQTSYKQFQGEAEYQEAFANATALLRLAFPSKKTDSDQMYSVWDQCERYVAHVLQLLSNYKEHPLKPTADFYNLLTACAHFLCEIGSYDQLEKVLEIGRQAYDTFGTKSKAEKDADGLILADLDRYSGLLALYTGKFNVAFKHVSCSLNIYQIHSPSNSPIFSYLYRDLSNIAASQSNSNLALKFAKCAFQIRSDQLISTYLMAAQVSVLAGTTLDARGSYREAIKKSLGEDKWAAIAFAYFGLGKLDYEKGDLDAALKYYELAAKTFSPHATSHEFVAACYYHLGSISLDKRYQSDTTMSIAWLLKSLQILEVKKPYLLADYARTSFKLAKAYEKYGEREKMAHFKQTAKEALRSALEADASDTGIDYNYQGNYDNAVCILRQQSGAKAEITTWQVNQRTLPLNAL
ncbi:hypothetical protein EG329_001914 [Mollisiaceae sp. DMI_Dod_QoI]|nr:hypothetical protein EG329_001914 [Helotiales sp. DMI_Dod_QoI]